MSLWSEEVVLGSNIVSDVAAASFIPHSDESEQLREWLSYSSALYGQINAHFDEAGVALRKGREMTGSAKRPWFSECVFDVEPCSGLNDAQAPCASLLQGESARKETLGWKYATWMVEPRFFLPWLRVQLESLGVRFYEQKVEDVASISDNFDIIVNCTGFGSRKMVNDDSVEERGGQILVLRHSGLNEWVRDKSDASTIAYVYPQRNTVVVGGTKQMDPGKSETALKSELFEKGLRLLPSIAQYPPIALNGGYRPFRPSFRVEVDHEWSRTSKRAKLVHNYGHGGEGYCFGPGCARRVRLLVDQLLNRCEDKGSVGLVGDPKEAKHLKRYQLAPLTRLSRGMRPKL